MILKSNTVSGAATPPSFYQLPSDLLFLREGVALPGSQSEGPAKASGSPQSTRPYLKNTWAWSREDRLV